MTDGSWPNSSTGTYCRGWRNSKATQTSAQKPQASITETCFRASTKNHHAGDLAWNVGLHLALQDGLKLGAFASHIERYGLENQHINRCKIFPEARRNNWSCCARSCCICFSSSFSPSSLSTGWPGEFECNLFNVSLHLKENKLYI